MNIDRETILNQIADQQLQVRFSSYLDRAENIDFSGFAEEVDQSDYSVSDWVDAFIGFDQWLLTDREHFKLRDFGHMLGYLHCCQMTISDNLSKPEMRIVVTDCLQQYGYEPSEPSQI